MTINVDKSSDIETSSIQRKVRVAIIVLTSIVAFISLIVILGWIIQVPIIGQIFPDLQRIKFNTAVGFLLLSIAIFSAAFRSKPLPIICSILVFLIAIITLVEYLFKLDLGIDHLLFFTELHHFVEDSARVTRNSAINFTLLSLGVFVFSVWRQQRLRWFFAFLAAVSFSLVLISLTGQLIEARNSDVWFHFTSMKLLTSICFGLLALAAYFLSWTYNVDGKPAKWVIVPLGLVSFLTLFAMWRLHDIVLFEGDGSEESLAQQYTVIALSLFLTGFGLYVFQKAVRNTQELEMADSRSRVRGREREMLLYYLNEEVRAPLFAIQGYLDLLKLKPEEDTLDKAISAATQVHHVLNDLVVVMQEGATGLIAAKHEVNFDEVYKLLTSAYEREAKMHHIDFEHKVEGSKHPYVVVDWEKVSHVLAFILHKAFLRTPEDKRVQLLTYFTEGSIEFKIIDTGGFISEAEKARILSRNPFIEQDKLDRTHLGFYVCTLLLRSMNSELCITKVDPDMTEFAFTISN